MQYGKKVVVSCCMMFAISAAPAVYAMADQLKEGKDNPVAAKVNGKPIYLDQLRTNVDGVLAKYRKYGAAKLSDEAKKRIQKEELDKQISFELLVQAGEKTVGSEFEQRVAESLKDKHSSNVKSGQVQKTVVGSSGNDESRKQVRRKLLVEEYLASQGLQDVRVPESELKTYYERNKQSFTEAASRKVSHILIALPPKPKPEEITEAANKIGHIREEIINGKSFTELAKQYSKCASAAAGGDLGYITRGYMPNEFDKIAFDLKEGEISEVVRTRHGFHIIKAFDKKPERINEFGEVKDLIEKFLVKKEQAKRIDKIVEELKRSAKVEVYLN